MAHLVLLALQDMHVQVLELAELYAVPELMLLLGLQAVAHVREINNIVVQTEHRHAVHAEEKELVILMIADLGAVAIGYVNEYDLWANSTHTACQ